jgi:DNA-binding transcriptional LysR family regulator
VVAAERAVVVADSSRRSDVRGYGILGGPPVLAVPSMRAKILAQREGLGVGWLPRARVASLLSTRELIEKRVTDPRAPNTLYVGWRGNREGRGLLWWVDQLKQKRLARALVEGIDEFR